MITSRTFIAGSEYNDSSYITVNKSSSTNLISSNYNVLFDSPYGRHKSDFNIGDEVRIYAGNGPIGGMVNQWRLLEGSGVTAHDEYISGTGFISGGTWSNAGSPSIPFSTSLKLNGGSNIAFVNLGSAISQFPSGAGTISFWFNNMVTLGDFGADGTPFYLLGSNTFNTTFSGTNMMTFRKGNAALGNNHTWATSQFTTGFRSSDTTHVTMTWAGSNQYAYLYSNGSRVNSGVQADHFLSNNTNFSIGGKRLITTDETRQYADFYVSDFRIYNQPLSSNEIANMYNNGSGTIDKGLITGTVDTISFDGEGLDEKVEVRGRDYVGRLMDNTIEPVVYTNTEIGSIVRDILKNNEVGVGSDAVNNTDVNLPRIAFNHSSMYEGLQSLSELSSYSFYTDNFKQLHFEITGSSNSNITFDNSNISKMNFDKSKENMANRIWVYGDRQLSAAPRELFMVGADPGSVYTLKYSPHNTQVQTSNTTIGSNLKGDILNMVGASSQSGIDYLVNFFDRQIVFVSGTDIGYSTIPNANGSVIVNYERNLPIAKYGENRPSIQAFGPKTLIIQDTSIKDPATALSILKSKVQEALPLNNIEFKTHGWIDLEPNMAASVDVPNFELDESNMPVIEVNYTLTPEAAQDEDIISLRIDNRFPNLTDKIQDLKKRISDLEHANQTSTDLLTRLEFGTGSLLIVGSYWTIQTNYLGSEFRVWPSSNVPPMSSGGEIRLGLLNSGAGLGAGSMSYLASGTFTNYSVIASGGYV